MIGLHRVVFLPIFPQKLTTATTTPSWKPPQRITNKTDPSIPLAAAISVRRLGNISLNDADYLSHSKAAA